MKVLTYNILTGGGDGGDPARWQRVVELLQRERPDVLGLQECNGFEADGARRLRELEDALGMRGRLATAASGYHVALFVRDAQLEDVRTLRDGFAHAAIVGRAVVEGRRVVAVVAHLSPFSSEERLHEAEHIAALCEQSARGGAEALVLGDLNAISPIDAASVEPGAWPERYRARHLLPDGSIDTRALGRLESAGLVDLQAACARRSGRAPAPTRPTRGFAGDRPVQRLDYIFASDGLAARASDCRPCTDALAERASDHRPLWAELVPT